MRLPTIALAAIAGLLSTSANATGTIESLITKADRERLQNYEATRDKALDEIRQIGDASEVAEVEALLKKPALAFGAGFNPLGNWQCRTTKLGGSPSVTIYSWFRCRITDDGSGWMLEKLSGSQRTRGRFFTESDTRLTYLGVSYVNNDKPPTYGAGPESDQVGYVYRTGDNGMRIEFPSPHYESVFDILELKR
ncbi:MAG: DUF4893 domain-containing protein [Phyllobacterium sp.]